MLLEGVKSETFSLELGVAQGHSLSPILFPVFVNDLVIEVEEAGLGVQINNDKSIAHLLFVDDWDVMGLVMLELDSCLNLGQERMV